MTITPKQAESILQNLSQNGINITLKRTQTVAEKSMGGGFLPLLLAAAPAIGAAVGTGALSGAAGFGTQALLNELTGSGAGPTVTLAKSQWERLNTDEPIVINFKVSKANKAKGQSGGSLSGRVIPMMVRGLTPIANAAGNALGRAAIKGAKRLTNRAVRAGEQRIGQYIDGNASISGRVPGIPVSAVQPQDSFGGFGVFQDLQSTVGTVPVVGAYAQRGLAPVATAEYLAEQGTRLGRDALNVYNDGRAVGNNAKKMMGLGFTLPGAGYKLAGEGHRKKKKHHWLK